ncbi:MAG: flagellar filament capping protein FliD [Phycisphaeraceae bacterium]|nr:flagellar filament capping protein FliD [Phycisphaeraceae bacterium]
MSGISSSIGLISGLNTTEIINQLLRVEARPRQLAQQRVGELQTQQSAWLDLNSRLSTLKSASAKFRIDRVFESAKTTSSHPNVLTATATAGATAGSYRFIVDRVVGTQQSLSRGFVDRSATSLGLTSLTFEPEAARLDRDTSLSELNGGNGVSRGKVEVTDSSGARAVIDLSRVATVNEVLQAFNTNSQVRVRVELDGTGLKVTDLAGGGGTMSISNVAGYTTAESLGIQGSATGGVIAGSSIHTLGDNTSLQSLRNGLGVRFNQSAGTGGTPDFTIKTRDGSTYQVDVGDIYDLVDDKLTKIKGAVTTFGQLRDRIAEQTDGKVQVRASPDGQRIELVDTSTPNGDDDFEVIADTVGFAAQDLGFVGSVSGSTLTGGRVLANLNSTLASVLGGGSGLSGNEFEIVTRSGDAFSFRIDTDASLDQIIRAIRTESNNLLDVRLNANGTGLIVTDTSSGPGSLVVTGSGAEALGISTSPTGVVSGKINGDRLQKQYVTESTLLGTLNSGSGLGTGRFEIIGPGGSRAVVDIAEDSRTVGDIISEINSKGVGIRARINDRGDGIVLEQSPGFSGSGTKIKVTDLTGAVARNLRIAGEAADDSDQNFIDGSAERTISLTGTESLDDLVKKINEANAPVRASVITDGSSSTPFRLRLTSALTGEAGRFLIDTSGADLGLSTVSKGENARVFFGSDDPATAILVSSTTNTVSGLIDGVTLNVQSAGDTPATITVSQNVEAVESSINEFVTAFNEVLSRISRYTSYNAETEQKGVLLGDSTALQLRSSLYTAIQRQAVGVTGTFRSLSQVGLRIGQGATLQLDVERLRRAVSEDPEGVRQLFAASELNPTSDRIEVAPGITAVDTSPTQTYRSRGIAELLVESIDQYLASTSGILTRKQRSLDDQIRLQNDRISRLDTALLAKRASLERQFASLEQTLARLQNQQSSIAGLAGLASQRRA